MFPITASTTHPAKHSKVLGWGTFSQHWWASRSAKNAKASHRHMSTSTKSHAEHSAPVEKIRKLVHWRPMHYIRDMFGTAAAWRRPTRSPQLCIFQATLGALGCSRATFSTKGATCGPSHPQPPNSNSQPPTPTPNPQPSTSPAFHKTTCIIPGHGCIIPGHGCIIPGHGPVQLHYSGPWAEAVALFRAIGPNQTRNKRRTKGSYLQHSGPSSQPVARFRAMACKIPVHLRYSGPWVGDSGTSLHYSGPWAADL